MLQTLSWSEKGSGQRQVCLWRKGRAIPLHVSIPMSFFLSGLWSEVLETLPVLLFFNSRSEVWCWQFLVSQTRCFTSCAKTIKAKKSHAIFLCSVSQYRHFSDNNGAVFICIQPSLAPRLQIKPCHFHQDSKQLKISLCFWRPIELGIPHMSKKITEIWKD